MERSGGGGPENPGLVSAASRPFFPPRLCLEHNKVPTQRPFPDIQQNLCCNLYCQKLVVRNSVLDFPGGTPASAGDTGWNPDLGRFHTPRSS